MKRILSFIICFAVSASLTAISSFATPEFTMDDAESLIGLLEETADILFEGNVDEFKTSDEIPTDEAVKVLNSISPNQYNVDDHGIYYPAEQYKAPEYWKEKLGAFLTSDYIEENFEKIFDSGIIYHDGKIYVRTGFAVQSSAGYDSFSELKNKKITSNGDKALLSFTQDLPFSGGTVERSIEFRYTENGWRIAGGTGADSVLGIGTNPNTSDIVIIPAVCLLVSMLGIGMTLSKKRIFKI